MKFCLISALTLVISALLLSNVYLFSVTTLEPPAAVEVLPEVPLGLPPVPWPEDNPYSKKKAELGRLLYFDTRLSTDNTISCSTCHLPSEGFAQHQSVSLGVQKRAGNRNSPTVINTAYQSHLFWDGRANSLEEQAKGPLANPREMTLSDSPDEAHRLCQEFIYEIEGYRKLFKEAFGDDSCSIDQITKAIATFERTILSGNSPYDRYAAGDKTALNKQQIEGLRVFKKAGCADCHGGFNFSDGRFLNIGVGMNVENPDLGRYEITKNSMEKGAFKVPTLRDVSKNYPYMHDGSLATLEEVIDYYDRGGNPNPHLSPLMKPLHLSKEEKAALLSFMIALDGEGWQNVEEPLDFPK